MDALCPYCSFPLTEDDPGPLHTGCQLLVDLTPDAKAVHVSQALRHFVRELKVIADDRGLTGDARTRFIREEIEALRQDLEEGRS